VKQQILVVEDDARIADLIVKNLEAVGYACHASPDGGRALADYERLRPALVVLDLGSAGSTGWRSRVGFAKRATSPSSW
jgi:DNA-binding response OmpR family regulator